MMRKLAIAAAGMALVLAPSAIPEETFWPPVYNLEQALAQCTSYLPPGQDLTDCINAAYNTNWSN